MASLLDEEMPVVRGSDNSLIYLMASLLFISLGIAGYLGFQLQHKVPVTNYQKEKVIYKPVYTRLPQVYTAESNPTTGNQEPDHALLSDDTSFGMQVPLALKGQFNTELYRSGIFLPDLSALSDFRHSGFIHQISPGQELAESIRSLSPGLKSSFPDDQKPEIADVPNRRKIEYNLGMITLAANNMDFTGFGFATGVNVPLGNKWGLHTGLAVNFISRDYQFYPVFQKNVREEIYKFAREIDLEDQETYYSGLRSFKQILVPLGISYNLSEAFAVNSGFKLRYTYSEEIEQVLKNSSLRKLGNENEAEQVFFNQANVGFYAGINYNISNRFSINLDSEWGLGSIIRNDEFAYPSNRSRYNLNLVNLTTQIRF